MFSLKPLIRPQHFFDRVRSSRLSARRGFVIALALVAAAQVTGCGGKPFNVKEKPFKVREGANMPPPEFKAKAEAGAVTVQAEAVTDEDFLYDTFDANLILAGVLPVGIIITNSGQEALDLRKARFEIRTQQGRGFNSADAKRAFKRLLSYYEISTYSKSGYKKSQEDFLSYSLDAAKPVAPGETREGMIFFLVPVEVAQEAGVTLSVSRLGAGRSKDGPSVELKLR
ncbi:MAG TPA: hypothetical protein VJZ26_14175 [Blastocatellia bacterium]|nr:hypothetical protein [Blastocatellia bacterium]